MKIGIITGSGLSSTKAYEKAFRNNVILKDIDLKSLLSNGYSVIDPTFYYKEVVDWFKTNGITRGTTGCLTFCEVGQKLFKDASIKPICDITSILYEEIEKYDEVGWLSTSTFRIKRKQLNCRIKDLQAIDQNQLDKIIFNELAHGNISIESIEKIESMITNLNCKNVVFACTDLSVLKEYFDNVIDAVDLHINRIKLYY